MRTIYFITSNNGKLHEVQTRLRPLDIEVVQKNIGYPEIQAKSLEEVATYGIDHVRNRVDHPFILEDTGIFIDALKDFPGVYAAYVYQTIGLDGIIHLLKDIPIEKRRAIFRSVFGYGDPEGNTHLFIGECEGMIGFEKKGTKGFGYDPIFIPKGKEHTFAEINTEEKNSQSHRGRALEKLISFLSE